MSEGRFAEIDWASEEHAECVVDERGRIVEGAALSPYRAGDRSAVRLTAGR